ncbi:MAG: hypothetical protein ACM3JJ_04090 [Hyphomicrobiales bacterium]
MNPPALGRRGSAARTVLFLALLAVVVGPRFDLRDPGPIRRLTAGATAGAYGHPIDVEGYVRLVAWFRGQAPADSMIAPFCYRPLAPALASPLPVPELTALDTVNVLALAIAVLLLDRILLATGAGGRGRTAGLLLFIVSFPTFYYGAIGFIDPVAVLVVTWAALLALRERWGWFAATVVLGVAVKETNAVIALFPLLRSWGRGGPDRVAWRRTVVLAFLAVAVAAAIRLVAPFPGRAAFWAPTWEALVANVTRPRAWMSLALTLGLPALLAVGGAIRDRARGARGDEIDRFLGAGCLAALSLYAVSLLTAYADGRVVWIIAPLLVPLAVRRFRRDVAEGSGPIALPSEGPAAV